MPAMVVPVLGGGFILNDVMSSLRGALMPASNRHGGESRDFSKLQLMGALGDRSVVATVQTLDTEYRH